MKTKLLVAFVTVLLAGAVPTHAQTGKIAGTVADSLDGETLPGANVRIVGTEKGTSTGADGTYTIAGLDPGNYEVRASFVGYSEKAQSVTVASGETTQLDFALVSSTAQLEEVKVVAVGYGTRQRENVTSSISSVDSEDFIDGPARDVAALIEGQIAGLNVTQSSGSPSAGSQISLRGTTTLSASSAPLVLIDGVPGSLQDIAPQNTAASWTSSVGSSPWRAIAGKT
jgi:hypothetical protein